MGTIIDIRGLFFMGDLLFTKNEFIVEEEIENHNDDGVENEGAGSEDKFVRKG